MKLICCILLLSLCFCPYNYAASDLDADTMSVAKMQVIATKILNDLKAAKGILPDEAPTLRVIPFIGSVKIAVMRFEEGLIDLDTRTFKIGQTVSQGRDNALAWIIGHELGHFINKHGEINHFDQPTMASVNRSFKVNSTNTPRHPGFARPASNEEQVIDAFVKTRNEGEADFEGAFLAFLAGYQPMEAGKELIEKIYSDTLGGLTANTPGYPSLADRKKIIEETSVELAKLRPIYESAMYLSSIGQYADAATLLEEISRKFESREVYNNIGVLHVLHCLQNMPDEKVKKYDFPLVYDADFRGPHPRFESFIPKEFDFQIEGNMRTRRRELCKKTEVQLYLEKAEEFFQKAIALDPDYAAVYLNLSIAQSIKACLYVDGACSDERKMEYAKAEGNAYVARELAHEALSAPGIYTLEHFNFIPSDSLFRFHFPDYPTTVWWDEPHLIIDSQFVNGQIHLDTTIKFRRPAIYKEIFGNYDLELNYAYSWERTQSTVWGPVDTVPLEAVLLSKIHVQIDLIKILRDDLNPTDPFQTISRAGGVQEAVPFDRALELDRNSLIARTNQQRFLNQLTPQLSSPSTRKPGNLKYKSKEIDEIEGQARNWNITVSKIDKSRLAIFKTDSVNTNLRGTKKIHFTRVNNHLNFKYYNNPDYRLYVNYSRGPVDNREEKSIFLEPVTFDFLKVNSDLTIIPGMHIDSITNKIGAPDNSILLLAGQLSCFETSFNQEFYQLFRSDGSNARGDTIIQNFRQLIKIDPSEVGTFDPENGIEKSTTVDKSIHEEQGIILKIDAENRVNGYVHYFKRIKTEGGILHTNNLNNIQMLSPTGGP